ncbi:MAG: hypothetical protein U0586_13880 [Candidatus Brocadiaceae bacterium]
MHNIYKGAIPVCYQAGVYAERQRISSCGEMTEFRGMSMTCYIVPTALSQ